MSSSQEFIVRVPREGAKKYNVMRFGSALNVDPNKWKSCQMFRENDLKDIKTESNETEIKEFGAGSEFGRKQKEEMRKKKYTKRASTGQQPWVLKTSGKGSRKYKGLREGGVSENASYYVFFQAPDGAFEAFPVEEWYNFTPIQRYKALTAEEAEEKFEKRDKILNYFSVMINKKKKDQEIGEHSGESKAKVKKELKVSDMDDWHGMDSDRSDGEAGSDEDVKPKIKNKKKEVKKKSNKKKKGSDDDDNDSEPLEESDEGDFDDKEVDYMSESSDSSDEDENEKIDKAMKSVAEEDALRQLVLTDDEDEEEEKEDDQKDKEEEKTQETDKKSNENDKKSKFKDQLKANFDSPPPSSSDSDSDDPDSVDDKRSALLAPVKLESDKSSRGSSRSATPTALLDTSSVGSGTNDSSKIKRKLISNDSPNVKRSKLSNDNSEVITEEAVRRYLMRKPMTCTDLLQKFKNKVSQKSELVHTMAQILKRLNPEKLTIKNKIYFSLKPT